LRDTIRPVFAAVCRHVENVVLRGNKDRARHYHESNGSRTIRSGLQLFRDARANDVAVE
jgi:hypothetical protein